MGRDLVYDLQGIQSRHHAERGIARYVLELALALERLDPTIVDRYTLNPALPIPPTAEPLLATGKVVRLDDPVLDDAAVFHVGSPFENGLPGPELIPPAIRRARAAIVATMYDLIPLIYADHYLVNGAVAAEYRRGLALVSSADHLLAISESTKRDAVRLLGIAPERIEVIHAGAGRIFRPPVRPVESIAADLATRFPDLRPGYVLVPTGIDFRKNIAETIAAFGALPAAVRGRHQLVITCRVDTSERQRVEAMATEAGVLRDLLLTGFVSDADLVALYQAAHLVVFPSRYEGFGLPPLEARQCGAPVVCGDNSSLVEVVTNPEARFDAADVHDIARVLGHALSDEQFRQSLIDDPLPELTWDRAAALTAPVYDQLRSRRPIARRRRLGVVTPLPPTSSGIADYSAAMVESLSPLVDVTCFVDGDLAETVWPKGANVAPLSHLPIASESGSIDEVLYCLGNNALHSAELEMLARVPGATFLHDVRLVNAVTGTLGPDESLAHRLVATYPGRYDLVVAQVGEVGFETIERMGIQFARAATDHATKVLVHSDHARLLVKLDTGRDATALGAPACAAVANHGERTRGVGALVVSFGIVSPAKQSPKLIDGLPKLVERVPEARLALVGHVSDRDRDDFIRGSEAHQVGRHLEVTGAVDAATYEQWLERATLAVQLRDFSNGESSAAVANTLAFGLPTVVTALGSARELPDDVVVKVERDITPEDLATVIAELLADPERLDHMSARAREFAAEHTFDRLASKIVDVLFGTPTAR